MKLFFIYILLSFNPSPDLEELRGLFPLISKSESKLATFVSVAQKSKTIAPATRQAYLAAAEMTSAQFKVNPLAKLAVFKAGRSRLDACINSEPANAECRYVRLVTQLNAPAFLGYNDNINNDKNFLVTSLPALRSSDPRLYVIIQAFILSLER